MGVYVFGEPGMLLVKVGCTNAIDGGRERGMALRRFWGAGRMLYIEDHGTQTLERRVHRLLRARFWVEGEWFSCGADVAKSAVRRIMREPSRQFRAQHGRYMRRKERQQARAAKVEAA